MPFETNQHLFAGQGDDDAHEDDGDLTEKLSQITCRLGLMNFHRTLAIGFSYTLAPVRTRNYLMKRDAKFAPVGVVTVLFDDASPNPCPLDFLRTDRECLEKAWQAIQPTVRFTSPEWLLLGRSIRRLRVNLGQFTTSPVRNGGTAASRKGIRRLPAKSGRCGV